MHRALVAAVALAACGPIGRFGSGGQHLTDAEIEALPTAFPTTINPPRSPRFAALASGFERWNTVHAVGKLASTLIDLRRLRVPTSVEECGEANAFFSPRHQNIRICYELVAEANRLAGRAEDAYDIDTHFIVAFTMLHEVAHALHDAIGAEPANEEDRADQFAILMLTNFDDGDLARRVVRAPALFFKALDDAEGGVHDPTDVHSSHLDRAFNALCLLWGRQRDAEIGEHLGDLQGRCETLTDDALTYWNDLLRPYTRLDTGNTFGPTGPRT